ncbi:Transmembrane protein DDB_G0269096 [Linum perenne]
MAFSHLLQNHNGFFFHHYLPPPISSSSSSTTTTSTSLFPNSTGTNGRRWKTNRTSLVAAATTGSNPLWVDAWKPDNSPSPPLSDIFWPSAGAFAAMAVLGKVDQMLSPKGVSITIAPLGAVCAVLFSTPSSPAARKYNMFMAQIGCAAIGVLAFSLLGPGWLARSTALAASIAFMIYTRSNHPPAASLPLLFIDGAKLHGLNYWYALFPEAAGCLILCFLVSWFGWLYV